MRHRLIAVTGLLAGLLAAGTAGTAIAQDTALPRAETLEIVSRGGGQASADADAHVDGALSVTTSATGGGVPGLPVGPSTGDGDARLIRPAAVSTGTYQVVVTYSGASATEQTVGANSSTGTAAATSVSYLCGIDCDTVPPPLVSIQELPSSPGTVTTEFTLIVGPRGGVVEIAASVNAGGLADGDGSTASATASADDVDIEITRVG